MNPCTQHRPQHVGSPVSLGFRCRPPLSCSSINWPIATMMCSFTGAHCGRPLRRCCGGALSNGCLWIAGGQTCGCTLRVKRGGVWCSAGGVRRHDVTACGACDFLGRSQHRQSALTAHVEHWDTAAGAAAENNRFCISRWTSSGGRPPGPHHRGPVRPQSLSDSNNHNPPAHRAYCQSNLNVCSRHKFQRMFRH